MKEDGDKQLFTYHIIKLPYFTALKYLLFSINKVQIKGLIHAETMSAMKLGSSVFSFSRFFSRTLIVFAQWENEESFLQFMETNTLGTLFTQGWYLKLKFIRQWGAISGYRIPEVEKDFLDENEPVAAITLARMSYSQIPRFLRWGRPVEKLVRDHKGTTLSLASIRYPNLISTFSIWKSKKEMLDMVHGHSKMPLPKRHINAMKERDRKDFYFEFTSLRFIPVSEHGCLDLKSNYIPTKNTTYECSL